jgi:hypothetical protein
MSYVPLAIGLGLFLIFLTITLLYSINYFTNIPASLKIEEFREKALSLLNQLFDSGGNPENWEETGQVPSQLGLILELYRIPITVRELGVSSRQNEPVILSLTFDDECQNKTWNNTIRIYDENFIASSYEFWDNVSCSQQYINQSYIVFNVNISQNENKKFWIYYSEDNGISSPNYTLTYDTQSWIPNDGDSYSNSLTSWSRYGGSTETPALNSTVKRRSSSIEINGNFDSNKLGLEYNPASSITGVSNGWYIDAWIHVDDVTSLSGVNVSLSDNSNVISTNITNISSSTWYHFEKEISSSQWSNWTSFNASNGIDFIRFYMLNSSQGLTRTIKVDELHFELKPLEVKIFPEEKISVVSRKKLETLQNLTYEELKDVLGEDYKFRIEITGD